MMEKKLDPHEKTTESAETTLLPWTAPDLTIHSTSDITRSGSTSSRNDGSSVYAPTS